VVETREAQGGERILEMHAGICLKIEEIRRR
jgi:hypothetical protein